MRDQILTMYREVLRKVKEVLENDDLMKNIMAKYDKQSETQEEHKANVEARIKEVCKAATVDYDMYLRALRTSKTGYSVV